MTDLQKAWQTIERSIGYIQGFIPAIWVLDAMQGEREVIATESVGTFEDVVNELATALLEVRELTDREVRERAVMGITDELRAVAAETEGANGRCGKLYRCDIEQIADRIDTEYQKAIRELNNLADASVLLPVDADGVPIRVGDKVYQVKGGWVYTVKSITLYPDNATVAFSCKHGFSCDSAHNVRHYHAPTVEDVLWELLGEITPLMEDDEAVPIVAAYAEKLRLADDGEGQ